MFRSSRVIFFQMVMIGQGERCVGNRRQGAPVILFSGWDQRMTAEGELPDHVDRIVSKPPKLKDLREALADCYALMSNS